MTPSDVAAAGSIDGETFDREADGQRLATLLARVRRLMADGQWRTLAVIHEAVGGSEAGVSARLRDLRKLRFGGWMVERRRCAPGAGTWEYRLRAGIFKPAATS